MEPRKRELPVVPAYTSGATFVVSAFTSDATYMVSAFTSDAMFKQIFIVKTSRPARTHVQSMQTCENSTNELERHCTNISIQTINKNGYITRSHAERGTLGERKPGSHFD